MTETEKSLAWAKIMGWPANDPFFELGTINPYDNDYLGRAQFAAILLKHPEIMKSFCHIEPEIDLVEHDNPINDYWIQFDTNLATQTNILDEGLRMHGVDIDARLKMSME